MVERSPIQYAEPPFPPQGLTPPGLEEKMDPQPQAIGNRYRPAGKLKGKTALISGGDSGIGRSVAVLYAREGADVAIMYLAEEQVDADETARLVDEAGQSCLLIAGDIRDPTYCEEAVERTISRFGKLDILVNNAAFQRHRDSLGAIDPGQWDQTLQTNLYGMFYLTRAALPHLRRGASILCTGSITGLVGNKELIDYSTTKGAIHAFTKSLAQSLITQGIRVNCVAPGPVWTPLNPAERRDEGMDKFGAETPLGRPAQPEEIAPAYVFFASEADSSYISGEVLTLLGGDTTAG